MRVLLPPMLLALVLSGCSSSTPAATAPPGDDLHVYVSNQSFEQPVADILVTVDGLAIFDGEAKVEDQHNWMLLEAALAPGNHRIEALERTSGARATKEFVLPPNQERWVVVDYWYPSAPGGGAGFTITVHDEQVAFA